MSAKSYQFKETSFTYAAQLKKWHFKHPKYEMAVKFNGGFKVARMVAGALQGAISRKGELDSMGRGQINSIVKKHETIS